MREIVLTPGEANRRLDKFLFQYLNNAPHSFIFRMLRTKKIKLNGKRAQGGEIILPGDRLAVYLSDGQLETCIKEKIIPYAKEIPPIIFEDENILVINKPAGLASHGGMYSGGTSSGRQNPDHLLARVLYYLRDRNDPAAFTPALCNRLDVNTSGVVICAKTFGAAREINQRFAERKAAREYLAVVHGELQGSQTLEGFYRKDEALNKAYVTKKTEDVKAQAAHEQSRVEVVTSYETVCANGKHSLLKVFPVTGRSHQIRAHLASIGHPLLGDVKYGGERAKYAPGQLLHCGKIEVDGKIFEAEPPEGFKRCVSNYFHHNYREDICKDIT